MGKHEILNCIIATFSLSNMITLLDRQIQEKKTTMVTVDCFIVQITDLSCIRRIPAQLSGQCRFLLVEVLKEKGSGSVSNIQQFKVGIPHKVKHRLIPVLPEIKFHNTECPLQKKLWMLITHKNKQKIMVYCSIVL